MIGLPAGTRVWLAVGRTPDQAYSHPLPLRTAA